MAGPAKRKRSVARRSNKVARMQLTRGVKASHEIRVVETWMSGTIGLTGGAGGFPALSQYWNQCRPALTGVPQYLTLTGLFDLYRINSFTVTFQPRAIDYDLGVSIANPVPIFTANVDSSNTLSPGGSYDVNGYNLFLERCESRPIMLTGEKIVSFSCKNPKIINTSGEMLAFPWTSCSIPGTNAFGLDVFIHAVNFAKFALTTEFDVVYTVDFSFKGRR